MPIENKIGPIWTQNLVSFWPEMLKFEGGTYAWIQMDSEILPKYGGGALLEGGTLLVSVR